MEIDLLIKAYEVAKDAHEGQTRWGGEPYITHPVEVSNRVSGAKEKIVAMLHDTVEDTELTLDDLSDKGFDSDIVDAVDALTLRKGEMYYQYIERVSLNKLALPVKLADLEHNLSSLHNNPQKERVNKYMLAKMFLETKLD